MRTCKVFTSIIFIIITLALPAPSVAGPASNVDKGICFLALNQDQTKWITDTTSPFYKSAQIAQRNGWSIEECKKIINDTTNLPGPTTNLDKGICILALNKEKMNWIGDIESPFYYTVHIVKDKGWTLEDCKKISNTSESNLNLIKKIYLKSNKDICASALNINRTGWININDSVSQKYLLELIEAKNRNLDINDCRIAINLAPIQSQQESLQKQVIISEEQKLEILKLKEIQNLCKNSLTSDNKDWYEVGNYAKYVAQIKSIGLTIDDCRKSIGLFPLKNNNEQNSRIYFSVNSKNTSPIDPKILDLINSILEKNTSLIKNPLSQLSQMQLSQLRKLPDFIVCKKALNDSLDDWSDEELFISEVKNRKITVPFCKVIVRDKNQFISEETIALQLSGLKELIKKQIYNNKELCLRSLSLDKFFWNEIYDNVRYVQDAKNRGLTIDDCRHELGLPTVADVNAQEVAKQQKAQQIEDARKADEQRRIAEAEIIEQQKKNSDVRLQLLSDLTEFVKQGKPSTDLIKFSTAVSNFKTSLAKSDETERVRTYQLLTELLAGDQNYQVYQKKKEENIKQAELDKLNKNIGSLQSIENFIYKTIQDDPLNDNSSELIAQYTAIQTYFEKKEFSDIPTVIGYFSSEIKKLNLEQSYLNYLKSIGGNPLSMTQDTQLAPAPNTGNEAVALAPVVIQNEKKLGNSNLVTNSPISGQKIKHAALVIGNSNYKFVPKLENPKRDIELISRTLSKNGFDSVITKYDLSQDEMIKALKEFASVADQSDWSIIYFAGHGIEFGGNNYLIPIDAKLKSDRDIELETVDLNMMLRSIEGSKRLKMVILDACRDNPFASQMKRTIASRSVGRGLASIEPAAGTLVVYAAKNGETALDGDGENSPFATAIANRLIQKPALEVRRLVDFVRDDVLDLTGGKQQPFSYGSLPAKEDFYFGN